jgi:hypothetical protein
MKPKSYLCDGYRICSVRGCQGPLNTSQMDSDTIHDQNGPIGGVTKQHPDRFCMPTCFDKPRWCGRIYELLLADMLTDG